MPSPVIVWFRRDLRLADHPALAAAARTGRPLLPVYVLSSAERAPGGASRWWLHGSLAALAADLASRGASLVLRRGDPARVLRDIAAESGARELCFNRGVDPEAAACEERVVEALGDRLDVRAFAGDALFAPGAIANAGGRPFRVFTAFWRACLARPEPASPVAAPRTLAGGAPPLASDALDDWGLTPSRPDWAGGLRETWRPGEREATLALRQFVDGALRDYSAGRELPGDAGTSRLSARLHFGELSPRQAWHEVRSRAAGSAALDREASAYLRELGWREFSLHLLKAFPSMPTQPLDAAFERFPWRDDPAGLRAWQRGETGYPLVDAGLRELRATGWMHNRVRMVAASFLVKHLLVDWRQGEAWFWDSLVDADLANNVASWQWVAGCGADAAPYFRIFNPVLQGTRFDAQGRYVRRWVPELSRLPDRWIHAPWKAPEAVLQSAGVRLGGDYPAPIVAHGAARERALAAYATLRSGSSTRLPVLN